MVLFHRRYLVLKITLRYLKCLRDDQAEYVMREVHKIIYGVHCRAQSLAQKVLHQGTYCVDKPIGAAAYRLLNMDGKIVKHF